MRQRIKTLDGLRFLAALGVLWIHTWTMCGNPRFYIRGIDIASFMAIGGNGVDLFFVISGFCMYYFYASKTEFSYHDFYRFIVKRWVRLSPAFYVSTIIYALVSIYVFHHQGRYLLNLLNSVFYLNSIFPQYNIAPHFWTLGVEWQFYLIIPFLLMYQHKAGFKKIFTVIFFSIFLIGFISVFILKNHYDLFTSQLFFRGMEFGCGIIAARFIYLNKIYTRNRMLLLSMFIILTYGGRVLISGKILALSTNYYNLFKLFGFTIMGCGFAGILYLAITSAKWLNLILGNRLFKTMGKISYSFYLWHALILALIENYLIKFIPPDKGIITPVIITMITAVALYPVSLLSYKMLEKPFLSIGNLTTK